MASWLRYSPLEGGSRREAQTTTDWAFLGRLHILGTKLEPPHVGGYEVQLCPEAAGHLTKSL
jgi:hypothetical protein